MTGPTPLALQQIKAKLHQLYTGQIAGTGQNPIEREANFLSKALAAFALYKLCHCTVEESAHAIVDGGNDGGIDAVFVKDDILWLVQSKFIQNGIGQPSLGDVTKFKEGVGNIISSRYDIVQQNEAFAKVIPLIQACMESGDASIRACLVYSGAAALERDRRHLFQGLEEHVNTPAQPDFLAFLPYNLTSLRDLLRPDPALQQVDTQVTLHWPSSLEDTEQGPYRIWYGLMKLQDLVTLHTEYGERLISENIRGFKGQTDVNVQIAQTLADDASLFLYLNNGLTAYCQRLTIPGTDRAKPKSKRLNVTGLSIVNGAQTLGVIAQAGQRGPIEGFAFMRIISMERAEDERELARRITYSTNFQNQVHWRDFASLDAQQAAIAEQLLLSGVHYHYRDADNTPDSDDENFDFQEALLALACGDSDSDCDLCAKALSNRQALASPVAVYPGSLHPSRYQRLFSTEKPAEEIWRAVQVLRAIKARMTENVRATQGQRKEFFKNAKYLVAHILFIRTELQRGATLMLTPVELQRVRDETDKIVCD